MILSIASGKGGTGKTTVAVNLALSLGEAVFLDCDVEEPNAHIFLKPRIRDTRTASVPIPEILEEKCNLCGNCGEACAYNAIAVLKGDGKTKGTVMVFSHLCHSCGACAHLCPEGAIREVQKPIGVIEEGYAGSIYFRHGRLTVGEIMSPPLIRQVKDSLFAGGNRSGRSAAGPQHLEKCDTVVIDAPPGTSCPVITAVRGSDYCILVTEPTPFGLHDLELAVAVLRDLGIPFGVVLNRSGIGDNRIHRFCESEAVSLLMEIPFKRSIAERYAAGLPIVDIDDELRQKFCAMFERIKGQLNEKNNGNQRKRRDR
jgi:MinD superfamily P-loop ATPase